MIRVIKSKNDEYLKLSGREINLSDTLVGKSITEGRPLLIAPFDQSGKRICSDEPPLEKGYFIAVPIPLSIFKGTYGAIFIEGDNHTLVSQFDLEIISNLCDHAAAGIEKLHLINMIQSSSIYDTATGIYNYEAFLNRLNEEMHRSSEFNLPFALSTIGIDKYASFDPEKYQKRSEKVLIHVIDHIRKNLKDFDILGRISEDKFAVILVGADGNKAQLWSEKLRKEIASSVLDTEGKKFNVTVSQGLIASGKAFDASSLINNSMKVLEKALEKKNSVSVYS
jgi:diguanylate cyclase (GGDEF)-like protein